MQKLESHPRDDFVIACVVLIQNQRVTDRRTNTQTDRLTDMLIMAVTSL